MKLTKREKWLMQQAWNASDEIRIEGYSLDMWLSDLVDLEGCDLKNVEDTLVEDAPKVGEKDLTDEEVLELMNQRISEIEDEKRMLDLMKGKHL